MKRILFVLITFACLDSAGHGEAAPPQATPDMQCVRACTAAGFPYAYCMSRCAE